MTLRVQLQLDRGGFSLDARFTVVQPGISVLFGPSGCGKTTLLRCLAGLERARGVVHFNGDCWQDDHAERFMPAHRRGVGVVFQDPALFAYCNVEKNLLYAARRSGVDSVYIREVVELLDLDGLLHRDTAGLSGGERQRAAIARALLTRPRLLLLDEPLAALDAARKREIMPYLERLGRGSNVPIVYVTHNIDELFTLADALLLMEAGRITAEGPASAMLSRLDLPLAQRPDAGTVLEGEVVENDAGNGLTVLAVETERLLIPLIGVPVGGKVRLRVQARDVSVCLDKPEHSSILNILPATVAAVGGLSPAGQQLVKLQAAGTTLLARLSGYSCRRLNLEPGREVYAQIKSVALVSA